MTGIVSAASKNSAAPARRIGVTAINCGDTLTSSYNMTSDLTGCPGNGINIGADNIVLDCQGHTLNGTNTGIYLNGASGDTVKNCIITGFSVGIYLLSSNNSILTNNTANSNRIYGIYLSVSNNNIITSNTANLNNYGIRVSGSSNTVTNNIANLNNYGIRVSGSSNTVTNNTANSNRIYGIMLGGSNNTLTSNAIQTSHTASSNQQGLFVYGDSISDFRSNIDESNRINNLPVYYIDGINRACSNNTIYNNGSSYSYMGFVGCSNITVQYSSPTDHVLFAGTTNSTINGLNISYSASPIFLAAGANYNTLSNNTANSNNATGIELYYSSNNTLIGNTLNSNFDGIDLETSSNNTVIGNTLNSNRYGIELYSSSNNTIYNDYFNNTINAYDDGSGSPQYWNIAKTLGTNIIGGPYIGGNYWSDYHGVDTSSPLDGIGDTLVPYTSNGNISTGGDYLPLTSFCGDGIWQDGEWCGYDCLTAVGSTDMNHDCVVDTLDNILLIEHFNSRSYPSGDLNGDGVINMKDLAIFVPHYGDFITNCTDARQYFIDKKGSLSISFNNDTSNIINSANVSVNSTLYAYIIADDVQNLTSMEFGLSSSPNLNFSGFSASSSLTLFPGYENRIEIVPQPGQQPVSGPTVIGWATYNVTGTGTGNISIIKDSHFGELEWSKPPEELYRADFANIFNATINSPVPNITILSPKDNTSYYKLNVSLNFTISNNASQIAWIGYRLNSTPNVTILGPVNLTNLANGWNNITVFANDTSGIMGSSFVKFFYCLGDLSGPTPGTPDGKVDVSDTAYVSKKFGASCGDPKPSMPKYDAKVDMNNDCKIDITDVAIVSKQFGKTCK